MQIHYSFYEGITESEKKKWRIFMMTLSDPFLLTWGGVTTSLNASLNA